MTSALAENATKRSYRPGIQDRSDVDEIVLLEAARLRSAAHLRTADVLARHHFLNQLRRERLRTDRSKAPLSIALFTCHGDEGDVGELLDLLLSRKRETDLLGYLSDDAVAVLLPDTNRDGAERLAEKVVKEAGGMSLTVTTRTYPDQLFDSMATENPDVPDLYPFEVKDQKRLGYLRGAIKRGLDIIGASAGILLAAPVMVIVAAAVAMSSPGPVIFRQIRVGKGGTPFVFYKFRSMRCDMSDQVHRDYVEKLISGDLDRANQGENNKPLYKLKADPRITPVGRIIRETSLDELPQLFNVLRGDMSLVGPRPPVPYEVQKYQSWHLRRVLEVKPGITGLWQVEGRSKVSFDEMVRLDLRYVRRSSIVLDMKILLKTFMVVLRRDGGK